MKPGEAPKGAKSSNHKIALNADPKKPYKLLWSVKRQGATMGLPVQMNRPSDREGAEEFAARWRVKMPSTPK